MKSLRAALVFIGVAGVAVGLFALTMILTSDRTDTPEADGAIVLLVGWSFIGTGLFAWWRRPLNRTGGLMTAVGFAWFLSPLNVSDVPAIFIVATIFGNLPIVMLAQLTLSFPSGRLDSRPLRWLIAAGYVDGVLLQFIGVLVLRDPTRLEGCESCPANPIALTDDLDLFHVINTLSAIGGVLLLAAMVVILVRRWRRLEPAGRAAIAPVLVTGGVTLAMLATLIASSLVSQDEGGVRHVFDIAAVLAFMTVPYAFLFGLLRARFSGAAAVSELIEALSDGASRDVDIRDALAAALSDPSVEFAYWLPDAGRYVDAAGRPIELPGEGSGRGWSSVEHDGELVAAIVYDEAVGEHRATIRSAGAAASLALRNLRLDAELRANLEELRASRSRIVRASDDARRQLERDLHDGAQQHLVSMALNLRLARSAVDKDPAAAAELIDQVAAELAEATGELRELARGIHPAILTDRGLAAAIEALASRSPVPVEIGALPSVALPDAVESAIYFVVAEALTNVARYAEAESARVSIELSDGVVVASVSDDGRGGADPGGGTGLRGLQDRVAALDGRLSIDSSPGVGTTVRAEIPCAS